MAVQFNRVEIALREWEAMQQRQDDVFKGRGLTVTLLKKQELQYYESALARIGTNTMQEEKLSIQHLKAIMSNLEKQVYSRDKIFFRRLFQSRRLSSLRKAWMNQVARSSTYIKRQLSSMKLFSAARRVDQYLEMGKQEVAIPASIYLSDAKHLQFEVSIKGDFTGNYEVKAIDASYVDHLNPSFCRKFTFPVELSSKLDVPLMQNMLLGRAIKLENWTRLEFDENGVGKLAELKQEKQLNIEQELKDFLPVKLQRRIDIAAVSRSLERGNIEDIKLNLNGQQEVLFLKADPFKGGLSVSDSRGRDISAQDLSPEKAKIESGVTNQLTVHSITPQKVHAISKRNGVSQDNDLSL
ncbi:hypothetical protein J2T02_002576 [Chitinophaga terrae (ex Kim and Jung 2007)]|uniref:hypothetical protein n=1 Tax=Chitinophaga terrae (ex Kim and Jung 2007) TaxID=408074 RepID=UPI00278B0C9D|nr:hypothetical protein [Chitinophaga terrae (ex Kim and Jung 2007)]MDQ0107457.1 hypothetical protein [Chitinophaga terrae (ex Kim and Jung 2007)]